MKIAILMSTYNGEKYLREQLDSILAQKNVEMQLFVRDDGSSDSTPNILREYEDMFPNIVHFVNKRKIKNLGVKKSFLSLLKCVYEKFPDIEYFSFADQDDFWLEEKLYSAVSLLENAPNNPKGRLYYSNKTFVNENLELIKEENIKYYGDFTEVLWQSFVSGCTMVFDRQLTWYVINYFPQCECIHDNWIYRLAKAIDSEIIFDENSYIKYRQHTNNVLGMDELILYHDSIFYMIKNFFPVIFAKRKHSILNFMSEIYDNFYEYIPEDNKKIIKTLKKYQFNPINKLKLIFIPDMKKRSFKTRLIWIYEIIFNTL